MQKKAPLAIHLVMHQKFKEKNLYLNAIYSTFSRNVEDYLDRGLTIPVYYYETPQPIAKEKYEQNLVVMFLDDEMVADDSFDLTAITEDDELTHAPIALTPNAFKKGDFFANNNYIIAYRKKRNIEDEVQDVLFELAHAIGSLLFEKKSLKIFLSHAKQDGVEIAVKFRKYLSTETKLDSFFDVNSIKNFEDWKEVLREGVEESALLVFQTDKYSTREWCRKEVLMGKASAVPIVVMNNLKLLDKRVFPYMANVPTVTMKKKKDFQKVIFQLLLESIRIRYQKSFIEYYMSLFFEGESYTLFSSAPELLNLVQNRREEDSNFIYPEPPLGNEELSLLQQFKSDFSFNTPLTYMSKTVNLDNVKVAISVSESDNIELCGVSNLHLTDFIIELSRYLLATGTTLLYGGDVRYDKKFNFAEIIADLTRTYQQDYQNKISVKNYLAYSFYEKVDSALKNNLKDIVELIEVEKDSTLPTPETIDDSTRSDLIVKSLTKMRSMMTEELDIRIIAGAKRKGFMGRYSGVLEEAHMALSDKKPVFLIGAFCGVAEELINALKGEHPISFTLDYHLEDERFATLLETEKEVIESEYNKMVQDLNSWGVERLNNGLSVEENEVLFSSRNIYEIIYLILKGMRHKVLEPNMRKNDS